MQDETVQPGADTQSSRTAEVDATESIALLLRDLRSSREGLSTAEAERRLVQYGPNELSRRGGVRWPRELARQFTHPLALLLWAAAALAGLAGIAAVAIAIVAVIVINATFAFIQEAQAERAVEALAKLVPEQATVLRGGVPLTVPARGLVPGDVLLVEEGARISADARLLDGAIEVDASMLTGESAPALRSAALLDTSVPLLQARDLVLSGTTCTEGEARGLVFATGMHTELGRIAALSERAGREDSPLEQQVRRVAWLIALIAVALGVAFVPIAMVGAGLSLTDAVVFAVGLLVGNVPEGLLPVITLALAAGARELARDGAVIKRLSAVETLGSTDVICTDKTGTLTENRMRPVAVWTPTVEIDIENRQGPPADAWRRDPVLQALAEAASNCNNATLRDDASTGDPTEIAVLMAAHALGADVDARGREARRRARYNFDPQLKLMSTLDAGDEADVLHTKGAPESVLPHCTRTLAADGHAIELSSSEREQIARRVEHFAGEGMRVLALARRTLTPGAPPRLVIRPSASSASSA